MLQDSSDDENVVIPSLSKVNCDDQNPVSKAEKRFHFISLFFSQITHNRHYGRQVNDILFDRTGLD